MAASGMINDELAEHSLELVNRELISTLEAARHELEAFIDEQSDVESLHRVGELLHLAHGALTVMQSHGPSLLAGEMEAACRYLLALQDPRSENAAVEALTTAMVQLPIYLDRLQRGGRDMPQVLRPLLNELREGRGASELADDVLFMSGDGPYERHMMSTPAASAPGGESDQHFREVAHRLRGALQRALLGWIRNEESATNLTKLLQVSEALERAATTDPVQQLWRVLTAVLVLVSNERLQATVNLKRLVGAADRQLRLLIDTGERALSDHPPVELMNSLLYFIAEADSDGVMDERIKSIRERYQLDDWKPAAEQLDAVREGLAGPSARLMRTVAEAIKEDLGAVKDALDLFVRSGLDDTAQLESQLEMLGKIGDTLGVLGLDQARLRIQSEADALAGIVNHQDLCDPAVLEEMATVVLSIENTLDQELLRTVTSDQGEAEDSEADYQQVTQAVIHECVVNLTRVKEAVTQLIGSGSDGSALDQITPQLRGITAGLLMLQKTAAVEIVERIGEVIATRLGPSTHPMKPSHLERLADAIVSVEYYMETASRGRSDPDYMLDNAARCLEVLELLPQPGAVEGEASEQGDAAADVADRPTERRHDEEPATAVKREAAAELGPVEMETVSKTVAKTDGDQVDPEMLDVFIEEAREELVNIERFLPVWSGDRDNADALVAVRRSFHTLKGSGRMVGAKVLGEFSWAIENLLNRLINQTLSPTDRIVDLLHEAVAALPQLVVQLETGEVPQVDVQSLVERAHAFAEGRSAPDDDSSAASAGEADADAELADAQTFHVDGSGPVAAASPDVRQADPEAAEPVDALSVPATPAADPALAEVFVDEWLGHAAALHACAEAATVPAVVDEDLYRIGHTILGSATGAGFGSAVRLAEPLSEVLTRYRATATRLEADGWAVLRDTADEMELMAKSFAEGRDHHDPETLVARLEALAACAMEVPLGAPSQGDHKAGPAGLPAPDELAATVDPDVIAIFAEEATEILDSAEVVLQSLRDGDPSSDGLDELQRLLHTLKGGARMVGMIPMSDLSHAFETLLAAAVAGRTSLSLAALDVMQDAVDRLHEMRDCMASGQPTSADTQALIVRLEDLAVGNEPAVALAPDSTIREPESEPVQEPALLPADVDLSASPNGLAAASAEQTGLHPAAGQHEGTARTERGELARIDAALLDELLNGAGEVSIFQSRIKQQVHSIDFHLGELGQTVTRLREQLRKLESETEAQILHRHQDASAADDGFDPLELDRYSTIQELSRALAETASDVASIDELLHDLATDADTLLTQQGRVTSDLQDGLMKARMVPFERRVSRLARIVRQTANDTGKTAELDVTGAASEIDRHILDGMLAPLEHLLRNAVVHGIEPPDMRRAAAKPAAGLINLMLRREGSEVIIEVADDGAGLDLDAIRRKAFEQGVINAPDAVSDDEAADLILRPGFSTAGKLTQAAGRGVGMDVVDNEVKKLGGSMRIESTPGQGTRFLIRLPFTLAITHALVVHVGEESFALPLPTVEGVARVPREQLLSMLSQDDPILDYGGVGYRIQHLGSLIGSAPSSLPEEESAVSLVLVRAGDNSTALLTDSLEGSREVVVKSLGPHIATVAGVSGATILGDGRVVMILDATTLLRAQRGPSRPGKQVVVPAERPVTALVVDDSITMRRVTQRMLERRGVKALLARDGVDAIDVLQDAEVDIILLDIEMPRMDGYQFAKHVRNDSKLKNIPIIMVTSRSSEKHRARAIEIGVNDYLGKPYQDDQLAAAVGALIGREL